MQKNNTITAIYPNQKSTLERISEWFETKLNKFWTKTITLSFEAKDMPIETSVNNIADFVLNRDTHEAIELIQKINAEIENRFSDNSESFLKQSQDLKNYLKTKK